MSIKSNKSKVVSLSLSKAAILAANLIAGMVFARKMPVKDYGTYLQTFLSYDLAVPILTLGIPSSIYYFLSDSNIKSKRIVLECLLILIISSLVFSLFIYFGGAKLMSLRFDNIELINTLKWVSFYPLFTFPVLLASSVWVSIGKVKFNALYSFIIGFSLAILLVLTTTYSGSYNLPIIARVLLSVLFFPVSIYYLFKFLPGKWEFPRLKSIISIIKFSIPIGLASILGTLTIQLSGFIVSFLTSPEEFAIYSNGAKEVPFIGIVTGSISVVILSEMSKEIKQNNHQLALNLFKKAAYMSSIFLFPIMLFLLVFSESFIKILYSDSYKLSVIPFRIYLLIIPARIAFYGSAFIALGRSNIILFRSIVDLIVTGLLCYFLTSLFGINGSALALIITVYAWSIPYNLYTLSAIFKVSFMYMLPFKKLFIVFIISLFSSLISSLFLMFPINYILQFISGLVFFGLIYCSLMYMYSIEFKQLILNSIKILK